MTTFFNLAITRTINRRDPSLIGDSLYFLVFLHMLGWMSMTKGRGKKDLFVHLLGCLWDIKKEQGKELLIKNRNALLICIKGHALFIYIYYLLMCGVELENILVLSLLVSSFVVLY